MEAPEFDFFFIRQFSEDVRDWAHVGSNMFCTTRAWLPGKCGRVGACLQV